MTTEKMGIDSLVTDQSHQRGDHIMRTDSINHIMFKYTLSGSDFNTKRGHWTLKAILLFVVLSLMYLSYPA